MFEPKSYHICAIQEDTSRSFLPVLAPVVGPRAHILRFLKKFILVTEMNPQSIVFYKNSARIIDERKVQVATGSWVIHPFSILRLYYEIYLTFGYFLCFIFLPMDATYAYLLPTYDIGVIDDICCFIALFDIFMNFNTGFAISKEIILMNRSKIAKKYIVSPFFVTDVLSIMPELHNWVTDPTAVDLLNYCGMLRICRLRTFVDYLERTLNYFSLSGFKGLFIKVMCVSLILIHYCSCFMYFCKLVYYSITEGQNAKQTSRIVQGQKDFTKNEFDFAIYNYVRFFYQSASYLLGIDIHNKYDQPWITYLMAIFAFFCGKILSFFVIVVFVDIFKNNYILEVKYQAMMSQVDSFMRVNQFPIELQKKIHACYAYKYGMKYLNQTQIEKLLSDKLKKEIRYHDCRKLVQNLHMFDQFPQKILEDILEELKLEIYMPNDLIIKAGSLGDCMFFISSGTVAVFTPQGKEVCHYQDGEYFGERCLIAPKSKRYANIVAVEICEIYKMERKTFKKYIEANEILYKQVYEEGRRRYKLTKEVDSTHLNLKRSHESIINFDK